VYLVSVGITTNESIKGLPNYRPPFLLANLFCLILKLFRLPFLSRFRQLFFSIPAKSILDLTDSPSEDNSEGRAHRIDVKSKLTDEEESAVDPANRNNMSALPLENTGSNNINIQDQTQELPRGNFVFFLV
jgi:hypothetical protein